jgi:uncharacterized membrane protein YesL
MTIFEKIFMAVAILLIVALVVLIPIAIKKDIDWEKNCKAAGGISYTSPKSYNLCLNPNAIVELK